VSRNLDRRHLRTKNRQKRREISHLPVLIAADLIVHLLLRPAVQNFVKRNIVVAEEVPKFHAAMRWRGSQATG
jgi:hypothetical protein